MHVIARQQLVGLGLWILASQPLQQCEVTSVKTAVGGLLGTKGAVVASLEVYGVTFCFLNVHLPSGEGLEAQEARRSSVQQIFAGTMLALIY